MKSRSLALGLLLLSGLREDSSREAEKATDADGEEATTAEEKEAEDEDEEE